MTQHSLPALYQLLLRPALLVALGGCSQGPAVGRLGRVMYDTGAEQRPDLQGLKVSNGTCVSGKDGGEGLLGAGFPRVVG